ncbi:MAG: LytTR family DNA-binding domain-containing protein [Ruminococcus sp.]|nr:LytTR family DNA-binding domain-containing protein [Ruminococcus sp.]
MKIAVCEDEKYIVDILEQYIRNFMEETPFSFNIDTFINGDDFRKQSEKYDLLFLDCELPDCNGLTLAKELRDKDINTTIIFVTCYEDYVYESFEVGTFRYILKPINESVIRKALIDFIRVYEKDKYIIVSNARENHVVSLADVIYIESDGRYTIVRLTDNLTYKSTKSISEYNADIEKLESQCFFRTHRRFFINMKHISEINNKVVVFDNGEKAEISRRNASKFNKSYTDYLKYFVK